jgi:metal-responsive CopG/Arc/MetJ family transcriptional regulator
MATIQIVIEKELLQAADRAARRAKKNRSALVRDALREHLRRLRIREMEEREIAGYREQPQRPDELIPWQEAAWPEE